MAGSASDAALRKRQAAQNTKQSNLNQYNNFAQLSPYQQNNFVQRNLTPAQQGVYQQGQLANLMGQQQQQYNNQIGDLLYSLMGLGGYGGFGGGGYGGGGGGGGGGAAPPDIGLDLGLQRDQINYDRWNTALGHNNQAQSDILDQLNQNLQTQQANEANTQNRRQFLGQNAAAGANTTAGVNSGWGDLNQQFAELMQQLGYQNQALGLNRSQHANDYANALKQNDFAQQGLDITAGKAGYENPFTIPNPVPVQRKKV